MLRRPAAAVPLLFATAIAPGAPGPARPEHDVTSQELVYRIPGMDAVSVRREVPYKKTDSGQLKLDLYYPADFREGSLRPAVVFVNGVGDQPGSKLKDWGPYRSWGRLIAASGWIAVTFEARGPYKESRPDIRDLFRFLQSDGARLGVDAGGLAAWACSGNVYSGLPVLMEDVGPGVLCAVVYYGSSPAEKIRTDLPVFFVRAGRDSRTLNADIDRLTARAAAAGAPWTLVQAPNSHHAFDVLDETEESRRIVRQTLDFFREFLAPRPGSAAPPSETRRALAPWFAHEYAEAASAYGDYVRTHPDDAVAYLRLGLSQAHLLRLAEAETNLRKAVSLGADRPADLYNVACGYALLGQSGKALDALERAVAGGFDNRQLLASDEDLASLRSTSRFQKLLGTLTH
jgi:dienelactone hydrolase